MSEQPKTVEPVPVQLTRIEGVVNLIAYQMGELKDDVNAVKSDLMGLTARVHAIEIAQATSTGSSQSWKTWLPIIIAAIGLVLAGVAKFGG